MGDLKDFATYVKTKCLKELTLEYLNLVWTQDIPIVKLVMEKKIFPGLTKESSTDMTMASLEKFLTSLEKGTMYEEAKKGLKQWEEDKIPIPGFSRSDIHPSDLVLIYAAQKKALLKFLPAYCHDATKATSVIIELEEYYTKVQNDAVQMLFKIQKETESKLKETEEKFRQMVQGVKDYAIYLLDDEGRIKSWNEGLQRIKGYTADEIIGKHYSIFFTSEDVQNGIPEHNLEVALQKGHYETEGWRARKDGSLFWANETITPIYSEKGELKGFSKITQNRTELKKAKNELESKALELTRSNTELEQFAYVASHDLQEPLRTINSYVQLLANRYKGKLDADADDFIHYIVDGSTRMRQLINSLLEYSRINRVKPFETINVNDVIAEIQNDLNEQIKITKATIKYKNLPDIVGDTVLIGQLFQNLIVNALKFRGDKKPEIIISGAKQNGYYIFSVKDNGIGISKEYWEKIFVIFQRLNNREQYPGTGIGLSICKKIAERHGGKMWVESEPGKGSVFYFTIKKAERQLEDNIKSNGKPDKYIIDRR